MDPETAPALPGPFTPEDMDILYQDDHLVVIHKPSGLQVHRSPSDPPDEGPAALQLLRDRLDQYVYPCHRLDRPTSGILVFALDKETSRELNLAFERREVEKTYLAIARGWPTPEAGTIDHPLKPKGKNFSEKPGSPAKPATTRYETLATIELDLPVGPYSTARYSFLSLEPETGRLHQIRRHLKHIDHPILGDSRYGDGAHNLAMRDAYAIRRLQLASVRMSFQHPIHTTRITISCPLADDMTQIVSRFNWAAMLPGDLRKPGTTDV